jgi:dTMP kinase
MSFITLEGGEGAGKSTQCKLLADAFCKAGFDVVATREPGGVPSAEEIRKLLIDDDSPDFHPISELLLIAAARFEHVHKLIQPSLKAGSIVVCDRFVDSTMAYQGFGQKLGKKLPAIIHNYTLQGMSPDLTIILDIDPRYGIERSVKANKANKYERLSIEYHEKVRRGFQEIANMAPERCVIIDAQQGISNIHRQIIDIVNMKLGYELLAAEHTSCELER